MTPHQSSTATRPHKRNSVLPLRLRSLYLLGFVASTPVACFDPGVVYKSDGPMEAEALDSVGSSTSSTGPSNDVTSMAGSMGATEDSGVHTTSDDGSSSSSHSDTGCNDGSCASSCEHQICGTDPYTGEICGECEEIGWPPSGANQYQDILSDVMMGHPFYLVRPGDLAELSFNAGLTPPGSHARFAVYFISEDDTPVLVAHTNPLEVTEGTNTADHELFVQGPGIWLEAGWYWLMVQFESNTPMLRSTDGNDHQQVYMPLAFEDPIPGDLTAANTAAGYQYFISGLVRHETP